MPIYQWFLVSLANVGERRRTPIYVFSRHVENALEQIKNQKKVTTEAAE